MGIRRCYSQVYVLHLFKALKSRVYLEGGTRERCRTDMSIPRFELARQSARRTMSSCMIATYRTVLNFARYQTPRNTFRLAVSSSLPDTSTMSCNFAVDVNDNHIPALLMSIRAEESIYGGLLPASITARLKVALNFPSFSIARFR